MNDVTKDFLYRRRVALACGVNEVTARLIGIYEWMDSVPQIKKLLLELEKHAPTDSQFDRMYTECLGPPNARTLEAIAGFGLAAIKYTRRSGRSAIWQVASMCSIHGKNIDDDSQSSEALISRYINPFFDYIEQRLPPPVERGAKTKNIALPPSVIHDSLNRFNNAHRDAHATCFIMMRFGKTTVHTRIEKTIKKCLSKHGLIGLLARDREFHDDLFSNILTYVHGCSFGIAVFERVETDEFNPNVALEVGYMLGLRKQVLLLKDQTLRALHTDLVGKLYREFNPLDPEDSIPGKIDSWLTDKGLA